MTRRTAHLHCCASCRATYEDNCLTPETDEFCNPCRSGIPSSYGVGRLPQLCCHKATRPALKPEIKTYRLAGAGTWWICGHCHRQFGYNPKEMSDEPARRP